MRRPWQIWSVYLGCLAVVGLAVGWLSLRALQADRAEAEIRRLAALEENARLALWRMDSMLAPFIAQESARPSEWYGHPLSELRKLSEVKKKALPEEHRSLAVSSDAASEKAAGRARALSRAEVDGAAAKAQLGDVANLEQQVARADDPPERDVAPPAELPKWVLLYFQFDASGRLTSPQVPESERLDHLERLEERAPRAADEVDRKLLFDVEAAAKEQAAQRVLRLKRGVDANQLAAQLAAQAPPAEAGPKEPAKPSSESPLAAAAPAGTEAFGKLVEPQAAEALGFKQEAEQRSRGVDEFNVRFNYVTGNTALIRNNFDAFFQDLNGQTQAGPMSPIIVGDMLLLARRAAGTGPALVQGCWLDWEAIRDELLATIADLLPSADLALVPVPESDPSRMLASLPARLLPGALPAETRATLSPVQMALVLAWGAMLLAAVAVAVLLRGVLNLSERRASFVSAVTHELRTPLTTFRMYSEMLAEGMVAGEETRRGYLDTLRVEADRLTHLVENVLAYARLERGGLGNRIQQIDGEALLRQTTGRSADRARQCGVELRVDSTPEARAALVLADPSAVEQILFNLVDNACKYAAQEKQAPIEVTARQTRHRWQLCVRDRGPGIAAEVRARLFQPFSKSAQDAAQTAPGVGLGLALCRRLARDMGGALELEAPSGGGAAFVLSLPVKSA